MILNDPMRRVVGFGERFTRVEGRGVMGGAKHRAALPYHPPARPPACRLETPGGEGRTRVACSAWWSCTRVRKEILSQGRRGKGAGTSGSEQTGEFPRSDATSSYGARGSPGVGERLWDSQVVVAFKAVFSRAP